MDEHLRQRCVDHGHVTRADLLGAGVADKAIYRAARRGELVRVRHGAYSFPEVWEGLDERGRHLARAQSVLRNARSDVALSHTSALMTYGTFWWDLPLDDVHLTRLDERSGRREAGVVQHHATLHEDDLTQWQGCRVTSATRTALDLTTIVGLEAAVVGVEGLLNAGLTTVAEIAAAHAASPFRPHTQRTDLVLRLVDPLVESAGEGRTLHFCWAHSLPKPQAQFEVFEGGRLVARLDLAWPERRVWLEFDGNVKYTDRWREGQSIEDVVLREKRREDLVRRLTGWICIRVSWADLQRPDRLVQIILQAFAAQAAA